MTNPDTMPILYSYYRSSCAYRVRIALNLKNISYETRAINLAKGETMSEEFRKLNPKGEVPILIIDGHTLAQSLPIIEYIDETNHFAPRLLPDNPFKRHQARSISEIICSGIQPLQNMNVLKRIGEEKKAEWAHHYIKVGLDAVEKALEESAGRYCVGNQLSIADCCLMPQLYNARRWKVDLTDYPLIKKVEKALNELEAFKMAHPSRQIDCPAEEKDTL